MLLETDTSTCNTILYAVKGQILTKVIWVRIKKKILKISWYLAKLCLNYLGQKGERRLNLRSQLQFVHYELRRGYPLKIKFFFTSPRLKSILEVTIFCNSSLKGADSSLGVRKL